MKKKKKADGRMKSNGKSLSRCASIWTQAVFWQIYYSRPVLNFELCSPIYRRKTFALHSLKCFLMSSIRTYSFFAVAVEKEKHGKRFRLSTQSLPFAKIHPTQATCDFLSFPTENSRKTPPNIPFITGLILKLK